MYTSLLLVPYSVSAKLTFRELDRELDVHSFLLDQHNAFPCYHVALWQRHTLCGDPVFSAETSEALTTFFKCSGEAEIVILFLIMLETYQKFLSVH